MITRMISEIDGELGEWNQHDIVLSLVGGRISSGVVDGKWEFTYLDGQTPPTKAEIDAEIVRLDTEWTAQEYARNRAAEYPSIDELTIALYDTDDKAALETKREAIKTKWPKDNSGPVE